MPACKLQIFVLKFVRSSVFTGRFDIPQSEVISHSSLILYELRLLSALSRALAACCSCVAELYRPQMLLTAPQLELKLKPSGPSFCRTSGQFAIARQSC